MRAYLGGGFGEEAAGDGGVGVEFDVELAEEREEEGFGVAGYGVVVALVGGGEDGVGGCLEVVDLLEGLGRVVGEAELRV